MLAFLDGELAADAVSDALADVNVVSAGNWAEVLSKFSDEGENPDAFGEGLESEGTLFSGPHMIPVTADDARMIRRLRPLPSSGSLSRR